MVMQTCVRSSEPRPHLARQIPNIVNSLCLHHCLRQLFGAESSTRNGFQRRASDITKIFRLLNLFTASTMTATATKRTRSSNTTPFFSNANENTIDRCKEKMLSSMLLNNLISLFYFSQVKDHLVGTSAICVVVSTNLHLDRRVKVDNVKQPVKRKTLCAGNVSHRRTSAF